MGAYISAGGKGQLPTAGSLSSLAQTHLAASQVISQLADGHKMNMAAAVRLLKISFAAHRVSGVIKFGEDLGERAQNQADAANAIKNPSAQSAATGGPKGEEPEDDSDQDKEDCTDTKLLEAPVTVKHHIFNKFRGQSSQSEKYRQFFQKHNINVDDFTVEITDKMHRSRIHAAGKNWTTEWKSWIDSNPNISTKEVYQKAGEMMDKYGISHVPLTPYR